LCYGRFSFFVNRDRYTLDNADLEQSFFSLRRRVDSLALATYIAELFGELAPREEEAGDYLRLILNSLHLLAEERRPPEQLKAICELRLMTMAGYMPDLVGAGMRGLEDARCALDSWGNLPASGAPATGGWAVLLPPRALPRWAHHHCPFESCFLFRFRPGADLLARWRKLPLYHMPQTKIQEFYHTCGPIVSTL
jgi:DNA repair protein RecO (recombination protein O)